MLHSISDLVLLVLLLADITFFLSATLNFINSRFMMVSLYAISPHLGEGETVDRLEKQFAFLSNYVEFGVKSTHRMLASMLVGCGIITLHQALEIVYANL